MLRLALLIFLSFYCIIGPAETDEQQLTLNAIYGTKSYKTEQPGAKRWQENGDGYTIIEASKTHLGSKEIVRYNSQNGEKSLLVSAAQLILKKGAKPAEIEDYDLFHNNEKLLLFTNTKHGWRHEDSGDYWLIDLKTGDKKKIGNQAKPSSLYFARIAPTGDKIAYMYEHNLYVEYFDDGRTQQLTTDGSDLIVNGAFDWVYEEEFDLSDSGGFRWSPDGQSIAYWRTDMHGVGTFYLINNTDDAYSKIISLQYPKAGTSNSAIKAGVVNLKSGKTTWFKFKGDSRNYYLPRMDWAGNSKQVAIQQLNRKQNTLSLYLADADSGNIKRVLTEKNRSWLDPVDHLVWFDQGRLFTWISDRDGWQRVYIYARNGKLQRIITPKGQDAIADFNINPERGWIYYRASPKNATQRYLYRSRLDGHGSAERITPLSFTGVNQYDIAPNQQWAFHQHSRLDTPYTTTFISLPTHESNYTVVDNVKLKKQLHQLAKTPHEYFKLSIDQNLELDGWMIKPPKFNPKLKYPVVFWVYAEPWRQTVRDRWEAGSHQYYLWHKFLAEQGYIVISVDNRGTPAPRGREWRKSIYGKIGSLTAADQAAAAREIIKWPFIDAQRVAIWGRSGGGSHTLQAMFRYPELYQTGIAVAPVPDLLLYDTIYQERYTGVPPEDIDNYTQNSAITFAQNLKGNLLILHGTGDDNVHYQGTEKLVAKLIEHNLPFSMLAYPNQNHGITLGKNTVLHKRSTMFRFLKQHVAPGGLPQS